MAYKYIIIKKEEQRDNEGRIDEMKVDWGENHERLLQCWEGLRLGKFTDLTLNFLSIKAKRKA